MTNEIFSKEISGPFTIPSGIVMTNATILEKIAWDVPEIGILTTKSISKDPRPGYKEPIFAQMPEGFVNAVGLAGPGKDKFAEQLGAIRIPEKRFLLASIIGSNEEEFWQVADTLKDKVDGFELNFSCPHAKGQGQVVGQDLELSGKIIREIRKLGKPVLAKLSPKANVEETVKMLLENKVDGVVAINTFGPEEVKFDGYPVLSNKLGGLSGRQVLEKGIKFIEEVREKAPDLPIIGCGGISNAEDILRYKIAGADFFGIGSALAGMNTEELKLYFKKINQDIENGTNFANGLLKTELSMNYKKIVLGEREQLADDLFILRFKDSKDVIKAKAGQFAMLWSPEKGEKPFSVYNNDPLEFLIQKRGCFTEHLSTLNPGDEMYVRGPYGNSPDVKNKKTLLVGGGTGTAALRLFAEENNDAVILIGAKDKAHIPDTSNWGSKNITIYTEDGSLGQKGRVTDTLYQTVILNNFENAINCGPLPMIEAAINKERLNINMDKIFSSEELMTMCGVGICGRCATKDGLRNCVDGTFISSK